MFYQLPPAGDPVILRDSAVDDEQLRQLFSPWIPRLYASGTASLAAAIQAAVRLHTVETPEVIMPAYGCPDLVSAAVYAGVKPVLVDLERERPWIDLEQFTTRISPSTVAVVAVNLFGIPERLDAMREIIGQRPIVLIEDSAQSFPAEVDALSWKGDLVVLSFGRGKPVSLLGGGAVLYQNAALGDLLPAASNGATEKLLADYLFWIKAGVYNLASLPRIYWTLHGMPFLHLGETRYHTLTAIGPMDSIHRRLLVGNIEAYRRRDNLVRLRLADILAESRKDLSCLIDLPAVCAVSAQSRLLRYPLLVAAHQRDHLLNIFNKQGHGASGMYPAPLPSIAGLEALLQDQGPFPAAADFARRILTLPTHSRVRSDDMAAMGQILRNQSC